MRTPLNAYPQHDLQDYSRLLTLREATTLLRLSPSTLRNLVRRQIVPCYRFAGVYRLLFKPDEILALLQPTTPRPQLRRVTGSFCTEPLDKTSRRLASARRDPRANGLVLTRED